MDKRNFFENIYDDFFGIEKIKEENEKLAKELGLDKEIDYPTIEVKKDTDENAKQEKAVQEVSSVEEAKEIKDKQMAEFFTKIDNLNITTEGKELLKKAIEYMRKYNEKIEKQYIQFNMCIYSENAETTFNIVDIISDAATFFSYVKRGATVEVSMYNLEKVEQINEIYNSKNSIILLKDFDGFINKEQEFKDKFLNNLEEIINSKKQEFITIINTKNQENVNKIFEKSNDIKERNFYFEITAQEPDVQDAYQEIIQKLEEHNELTDGFKMKLLDYITITYQNTNLSYPQYRDKLCEKILFSKKDKITEDDIPEYEKQKTVDEVFKELNELVGLEKVKKVLQDLVNLIELKNKTKDDLKIKNTNLHMVFLGNPGTGKTTVARMVAQILYNLKYIKQNKLIEVSSKDLVAEYVGQTGPKTAAVIEKALGGVLFIDEAYSLASGNGQGNSYNEEAIATLIQAMENHRDELVVIFAGYTKEMQSFLNANSGIVSRIGYTLEFEDYTTKELLQIFENMMKKSGFIVNNDALLEVERVINEYKDSKNFGNARFVRNVYEKTIIKHASNTKNSKSKKTLKTITKEDISTENLLK